MKIKSSAFKRILKSGYLNFKRNRTISISSIAILTTTLVIIGLFFFFRGIFDYSLDQVRDKVDIKVYFKLGATNTDIQNVKDKIMTLSEVEKVDLISADEALDQFKSNHENDLVTLQALNELEINPFGSMLTIMAKDSNSYESISNKLSSKTDFLGDSYSSIEKINYFELKPTIDRLNNIINWVNTLGYWIAFVFILISSLIIFNTIRLSIFIFRKEINIMRLVGGSNMYIRGPFLVESSIYAIISSFLTMILFIPTTFYLAKKTTIFFSGLDIFKYYTSHFFSLFILLLLISLILSSISCIFAMRKYLKI